MAEHRFFVTPEQITGNRALIKGSDVRHITRVLRLEAGDQLVIADGRGHEYRAKLQEAGSDYVCCTLLSGCNSRQETPLHITLYQALAKTGAFELALEKATELGVREIVPLITERTVVRLKEKKKKKKLERWQQKVREASKQSQRALIPSVLNPLDFKESLSIIADDTLGLFPTLHERKRSLASILRAQKGQEKVAIYIGPEGGYTSSEVELALEAGLIPCSLGPRVLRTETAALALISIVNHYWGDLGSEKEYSL